MLDASVSFHGTEAGLHCLGASARGTCSQWKGCLRLATCSSVVSQSGEMWSISSSDSWLLDGRCDNRLRSCISLPGWHSSTKHPVDETAEIYFLTSLEAGSPWWRCQQVWCPLRTPPVDHEFRAQSSLGARDTICGNSDLPELGCAILQGISAQTQQLVMLMCLLPNCLFMYLFLLLRASQVAQWVKNLPAMLETQEMQVRSLCWEDPLEKGMASTLVLLSG